MKKYIYRFSLTLMAAFLTFSCNDDKDFPILKESESTGKITATNSNSTLVLLKENINDDATTVAWNKLELSINTPVTYSINFAPEDNFESAQISNETTELSKTLTVGEVNISLIRQGYTPGVARKAYMKVIGFAGTFKSYSNTMELMVTPFDQRVKSSWGVVGDATANGWDGPDQEMFEDLNDPKIISNTVDLTVGSLKFRENNSWDKNYGISVNEVRYEGVLDGSENIKIDQAGTYKITVNTETKAYSIILQNN